MTTWKVPVGAIILIPPLVFTYNYIIICIKSFRASTSQ